MKEERGRLVFNARFTIDKNSKELNDLYVTEEEFVTLCRHFGCNRCVTVFRMRRIG